MGRILISAFDCAPGVGSEAGGAWHWALELCRHHEVTVLTDTMREEMLQPILAQCPATLKFIFYRPSLLKRTRLTYASSNLVYGCWQLGIVSRARALHAREGFDLILHLSYGVFRQTSWLGMIGPPFVFGPVGGGEDAPWRLKRSLRPAEKIRELARSASNLVGRYNPLLHYALSRTALVVARTEQTRACLPRRVRPRCIVHQEIGAPSLSFRRAAGLDRCAPLRLVFVGRLIGWKGVHFAIRAVGEARARGLAVELDIVGRGPYEDRLRQLASELKLDGAVRFQPFMPQEDVFRLMAAHDALIFPSLHDSGGNVVLEALAMSLPVICLDLGGPQCFVDDRCGLVVSTEHVDEAGLVERLAVAIRRLAQEPGLWERLRSGAAKRAAEIAWQPNIQHLFNEICRRVDRPLLAIAHDTPGVKPVAAVAQSAAMSSWTA